MLPFRQLDGNDTLRRPHTLQRLGNARPPRRIRTPRISSAALYRIAATTASNAETRPSTAPDHRCEPRPIRELLCPGRAHSGQEARFSMTRRQVFVTVRDQNMNRRNFLAVSGTAGLAAMTSSPMNVQAADASDGRDFYELQQVVIETDDQKKKVDVFLKEAAIPALNRIGINPVGVFYPAEGLSPIYVLLRHKSLDSLVLLQSQLAADEEFLSKGADFINAPASAPAFKRMESSLLLAFKGMPQLDRPVSGPERVFQLRTYESPSAKTGLKKIEMFNDAGEMKIFREVGLNPVFFGQTLVGTKMPCLTYMLGFKNREEQKAAWGRFGANADWKQLSHVAEYADKTILCGITNLLLVPAEYSQI